MFDASCSSSSFSIGGEFMLVSSLEELYDKFEAQTIGSKKVCEALLMSLFTLVNDFSFLLRTDICRFQLTS